MTERLSKPLKSHIELRKAIEASMLKKMKRKPRTSTMAGAPVITGPEKCGIYSHIKNKIKKHTTMIPPIALLYGTE